MNNWKEEAILMDGGEWAFTEKQVTEVIERLIEDIPDLALPAIYPRGTNRENRAISTNYIKQQLRDKWLQKGDVWKD